MSKVLDRYASAVHSSNLKSKPDTTYSDSDVLGAAGLAGKRNALAMALARLLSGDNTAVHDIVRTMSEMAWGKAKVDRIILRRTQADDMARAVLAWKRDGKCKPCGGHGFKLTGTGVRKVKSTSHCEACKGTTMVPFDRQFPREFLGVAKWLRDQVEQAMAMAVPVFAAKLAPKLELL